MRKQSFVESGKCRLGPGQGPDTALYFHRTLSLTICVSDDTVGSRDLCLERFPLGVAEELNDQNLAHCLAAPVDENGEKKWAAVRAKFVLLNPILTEKATRNGSPDPNQ